MTFPARATCTLTGAAIGIAALLTASSAHAQGRCIRAYGTPACNPDSIPAVFAKTGWRTVALDHITWRVADPEKEAAFYVALMGWKTRSVDAKRVVMDIGDWGTAVFRKVVEPDSYPAPAAGRGGRGGGRAAAGDSAAGGAGRAVFAVPNAGAARGGGGGGAGGEAAPPTRGPLRAVVEGFGFTIEPWNAKAVEAELKKRGMTPVAENGPSGFESFHVKDLDGFDLQLSNGKGFKRARESSPANAKLSEAAPWDATGWQTVWLDHFSYGAANYKTAVSFYQNLLGWGTTYDEGSQNEVMMGDVGDIIIRGGNPLDPQFGQPGARARRGGSIDHISFGITPWDTDKVKDAFDARGLRWSIDTSDGTEIHIAQFKSYHVTTPNGYNLQISYNTHDTRLNLAIAVNPRRPGVKWP